VPQDIPLEFIATKFWVTGDQIGLFHDGKETGGFLQDPSVWNAARETFHQGPFTALPVPQVEPGL